MLLNKLLTAINPRLLLKFFGVSGLGILNRLLCKCLCHSFTRGSVSTCDRVGFLFFLFCSWGGGVNFPYTELIRDLGFFGRVRVRRLTLVRALEIGGNPGKQLKTLHSQNTRFLFSVYQSLSQGPVVQSPLSRCLSWVH